MPPFVTAECTNSKCKHKNRYDLAELRKNDGNLTKGFILREAAVDDEEFEVVCRHCGRKFKFTLKGSSDGAKK